MFSRAVLNETGSLRQKTGEKRRELEVIKRDVERLIRRWGSAFENDSELQGQAGPDRYKELLTKKRELDWDMLRETLRGPDRTVAKRYLRLLVAKIIVHPVRDREAEIEVITKGTGVVAVMATTPASVPSMLTAVGAVHTSVGEWLPVRSRVPTAGNKECDLPNSTLKNS